MADLSWEFDTELDLGYPLYTRLNIGEVFPAVVSPLTATGFLEAYERGWWRAWRDELRVLGAERPRTGLVMMGIVGGYAYLNLSVLHLVTDRLPDTDARVIENFFASIDSPLPPIDRTPLAGDAEWRESAAEAVERAMTVAPDLRADRAVAENFRAAGATIPKMTGENLIAHLDHARDLTTPFFARHVYVSQLAASAWGRLNRFLTDNLGAGRAGELTRQALSAIGDIDSAQPARRLTELSSDKSSRYKTTDKGVKEFLGDFGFHGVNEFELASPSWEQQPKLIVDLIEVARQAMPRFASKSHRALILQEVRNSLPSEHRLEADNILRFLQTSVSGRERAKTTLIMIANEARLAATELGKRAAKAKKISDATDVFFCTREELPALADGKAPNTIGERRETYDELSALSPPFLLQADSDLARFPGSWRSPQPAANATAFQGIPGSGGQARGRARVVVDPYVDDPPERGEILIAPMTDPGWTPLFLPAAAVVSEAGGLLSHAVIVARELGIPCVTAAVGATTSIRTGDEVEVDGTTGRVTVVPA